MCRDQQSGFPEPQYRYEDILSHISIHFHIPHQYAHVLLNECESCNFIKVVI